MKGAASLPKDLTKKCDRARTCRGCEKEGKENVALTAWCGQCLEAFCSSHALPHQFSSGHTVRPWTEDGPTSSKNRVAPSLRQLSSNHDEPLKVYCRRCDELVCGDCAVVGSHRDHALIVRAEDVEEEGKQVLRLKADKLRREVVPRKEKSLKVIKDVQSDLASNADLARAAVRSSGERVVNTVKAFVEQKLQDIDDVENGRRKVLDEQEDELKRDIDAMKTAMEFSDMTTEPSGNGYDQDTSSLCQELKKRVDALMTGKKEEKSRRHAYLRFEVGLDEEALLLEAKRTVGTLLSGISADHCVVIGESSHVCRPDEEAAFLVEARDAKGKMVIPSGEEELVAKWTKLPDLKGCSLTVDVAIQDDGRISVSWKLPIAGEYVVEMMINGEKLPMTLSAQASGFTFDPNMRQSEQLRVVSEDRMKVMHTATERWSSIVGSAGMKHGCYTWKLRVENPTQ